MSKGETQNEPEAEKNRGSQLNASRRDFLKVVGAGIVGAAAATVIEYPIINSRGEEITALNGQVTTLNQQAQQYQGQIQDLDLKLSMEMGFLALGFDEQVLVESIAETIIPTDDNGPGAKEAGVIYFIDRQLSGDYGKNSNMYMRGPFVMPGQSGPITVEGITYEQGSPAVPYNSGSQYQYSIPLREFWRTGLKAMQAYSQTTYDAKFEALTTEQRIQVLSDLYDNKPTSFGEIRPRDFFGELIFMTWSGFLMDPLYGGNKGMVGWKHVGFNGVNYGELYGEGLHVRDLMVSDKPVRLQPASLGQWQKIVGLPGGGEGGGN